MSEILRRSLADLSAGLKMRKVWLALASEDIGEQHRRTWLGPVWLLVNYLAFAATFIFLFQRAEAGVNYTAYVATGLFVWFFMMEIMTQSVTLFFREEGYIKGTTLPLSVYVMRQCAQSSIRSGYALVGCIFLIWLSGVGLGVVWIWSILGLLQILLLTPAVVILFAFLGVYFPDSQFIVSNAMRIGMFLTPVFWVYDGGAGVRGVFYHWNPFVYLIEAIRSPIVYGSVQSEIFLYIAGVTAIIWIAAILILGRCKRRVVFLL